MSFSTDDLDAGKTNSVHLQARSRTLSSHNSTKKYDVNGSRILLPSILPFFSFQYNLANRYSGNLWFVLVDRHFAI